jgi:hypothetical protein
MRLMLALLSAVAPAMAAPVTIGMYVESRLTVPYMGNSGDRVQSRNSYDNTAKLIVTSGVVPNGTPDILYLNTEMSGFADIQVNNSTESMSGYSILRVNDRELDCWSSCLSYQPMQVPFVYGQPFTLHISAETLIGYTYSYAPGNPIPQTLVGLDLGGGGGAASYVSIFGQYAGKDYFPYVQNYVPQSVSPSAVPEPAMATPIFVSLAGAAIWYRRRQPSRS